MARRRSRAQRSISLEMLIGIVIALMVLSFLAGFFLGSRRAVGAAAEARAVELTAAAAADADAGKEAAEKEASEKEAEEKEAAEKGAGETEAAPVEARSDGNGASAAAEEPSAEVSVETTAAGTPEAAAGEAAPAESGAVTTTAAPAETRALATTAAPAETRALATTAASAETRAVSAGRDAGTGAGEAVAAETSAAVSAQSTGTQAAGTSAAASSQSAETQAAGTSAAAPAQTAAASGRAIAGNPEPDEAPTYLDNVIKDSPLVGVAAGTVYSASDIDTGDPGKYTQILSIEEGDYVYNRISGRSWQKSNEVALSDLRYVKVLHYNDEGKIQVGEMIVHKDILEDVTDVFTELFRKKYAVGSMHLIDDYFAVGGAEAAEAFCADRNNSTAFCSGVKASDGTPRAEAYGKAVLLNPGKRSADDAAEAVFSSYGFTKNGVRYEKR